LSDVGVLRTERPLGYGKGALVERLGLGVAALGMIKLAEVVEVLSDVGVVRAKRLFGYGKGALEERLGLGVAALRVVVYC
jgi:hypothetical protein